MSKTKTLIMGAAGRDFHNFNTFYRDNNQYDVAAFTATQIPDIEGRVYPPELAGSLYPNGIPIHDESELLNLITKHNIKEVVFSYSDLSHVDVMHKGAIVNASGADFKASPPGICCSFILQKSKIFDFVSQNEVLEKLVLGSFSIPERRKNTWRCL